MLIAVLIFVLIIIFVFLVMLLKKILTGNITSATQHLLASSDPDASGDDILP